MKKLNLTALTAAVLMGGSLLASSGAMAYDTTTKTVTAGTACKAYYPSQDTSFTPDWSTLKSVTSAWVHCPGEGVGGGVGHNLKTTFNLDIPVDAVKDIYNCYVAAQSLTSTGTANRKVAWKAGSSAGPTAAEITPSGATDFPVDATKTYTIGCYLYTGQMLHSIVNPSGQ